MICIQHIVLAMKPTDGNFAENAIRHGVAGINVGGCRIGFASQKDFESAKFGTQTDLRGGGLCTKRPSSGNIMAKDVEENPEGRFPPNVILEESEEVTGGFPESNSTRVSGNPNNPYHGTNHSPTSYGKGDGTESNDYRDSGSASRFFKKVREE